MDLFDQLTKLGERAIEHVAHVDNEEATKTALVLPFLQTLGYDVFNPAEVVPEYTADVGIKKGEKVDYAICRDGEPIMVIECKPHGAKLDKYSSQLYRYFSVTTARVAILTDGIEYRFYSDLVDKNKLDEHPFTRLNITDLDRAAVDQVSRLTKATFNIDEVLAAADDMRYISQIQSRFASELENPSDALVRVLMDPIYSGIFTRSAIERFRGIVRESLGIYMKRAVDARLRSALDQNMSEAEATAEVADEPVETVITTAIELEGLYAVRAILSGTVEPSRVIPRDVQSYFGILLDDNNRKPICRLWFNGPTKYLGVFDASKIETRLPVSGPNDLFKHADAIRASANFVAASG